jgi:hypothetical protein
MSITAGEPAMQTATLTTEAIDWATLPADYSITTNGWRDGWGFTVTLRKSGE